MATYNLNMTNDFCLHWGFWEAIREILQNATDEAIINPENEVLIDYNPEKELLVVSNKNSVLERKSLLFGGTTKNKNNKTVGKFGEGYKIGLMILKRIGHDVVIKNYAKNERWTVDVVSDRNYDDELVLKVNISKYYFKKLPNHNLAFEIKNVTKENWKEIQEKFLTIRKIDKVFTAKDGNQLLLDENLKGYVFINGLFVEKLNKEYSYGFNFTPVDLPLNRDRQSVLGFDFENLTKKLLSKYADTNKEATKDVVQKIKSNSREVSGMVGNYHFISNNNIKEELIESLKENNGELSYPVETQDEYEILKESYSEIKPVIVTKIEKEIIKRDPSYKNLEAFVDKMEVKTDSIKLNKSPYNDLHMFLLENKEEMFGVAIEEFEKLLEKSKDWEYKVKEVEEEEEPKADNKTLTSVEDQKEELKEIKHPLEPVIFGFDDDIPF